MIRDSIKTLLLDANGLTRKAVLTDTVLRGFMGIKKTLPSGSFLSKILGIRNESLSYVLDWKESFCTFDRLEVDVCNISNLIEYFRYLRAIRQYSLIIILHSACGDDVSILVRTAEWFKKRRGKLVVFVGNEYNLIADKLRFIVSVEADYVCSQLPFEAASWLYAECTNSKILAIPHALNPRLYSPNPCTDRPTDIGFIGDFYHTFIGDMERTNLIRYFQRNGKDLGVSCDIRTRRLPREDWAQFLRNCKGTLGAESGTYYLDRTGQTIDDVTKYVKRHPDISFEEVQNRFFNNHLSPVFGKAISSRHFEPVGTKTCQILIEGYYNGVLMPDKHYISVKKDLSNIGDVICRFRDEDYRSRMVERTYEHVMENHTYRHRIETLLREIENNF